MAWYTEGPECPHRTQVGKGIALVHAEEDLTVRAKISLCSCVCRCMEYKSMDLAPPSGSRDKAKDVRSKNGYFSHSFTQANGELNAREVKE